MLRSEEHILSQKLRLVVRKIAARNPYNEHGRCDYCHAYEGQRKHNDGCTYVLACEVRDMLNGEP